MSTYNTFLENKELAILRAAVDSAQDKMGRKMTSNPDIMDIIGILESFLISKKLICYGGTAINNILPENDQFYNKDIEIPDYDFFSPNALSDAKELANIYYKHGYNEVVAQAGVHVGTFKVFVNFIPIADITHIDNSLFKIIKKEAITVDGILYSPPNYLRMLMYLELSRPGGDVSRWEKVLKRLTLLNKHYPLQGLECNARDYSRKFEGDAKSGETIFNIVRNSFAAQGLVFFGGFATTLYSKYMTRNLKKQLKSSPDFDVLATDPERAANLVKEQLTAANFTDIKILEKPGVGEIIAAHYELKVGKNTIAFLYKPLACHSYNEIRFGNKLIKVATIDSMLSFYLAFIYANRPYYDVNRILCIAEFLFRVQAKNRLEQRGLLKRFSVDCYGDQTTIEDMRSEKAAKFKELKNSRGTDEFDNYFLRYIPRENDKKNKTPKKRKTVKTMSKSSSKTPSKTTSKSPSKTARKSTKKTPRTKKNKLGNIEF